MTVPIWVVLQTCLASDQLQNMVEMAPTSRVSAALKAKERNSSRSRGPRENSKNIDTDLLMRLWKIMRIRRLSGILQASSILEGRNIVSDPASEQEGPHIEDFTRRRLPTSCNVLRQLEFPRFIDVNTT